MPLPSAVRWLEYGLVRQIGLAATKRGAYTVSFCLDDSKFTPFLQRWPSLQSIAMHKWLVGFR